MSLPDIQKDTHLYLFKRSIASSVINNPNVEKRPGLDSAVESISDNNQFRSKIDSRIRELILENQITDNFAVERWILERDSINSSDCEESKLSRANFVNRLFGSLLDRKDTAVNYVGEITQLSAMKIGQIAEKLHRKTGEFITDTAINIQLMRDVNYVLEHYTNHPLKNKIVDEVLNLYGVDNFSRKAFQHPDFLPRMIKSTLMNRTYYEGMRQFLGWGSFSLLVRVPLTDIRVPFTSDLFRSLVDTHGVTQVTVLSAVALASLMSMRMAVDYYVLKKHSMTPDATELFLGLAKGKVDGSGKLHADPRAGFVGAPWDVTVSSLIPPYIFAWGIDMPYSIPAYILAIGVDQISFIGSNLMFSKYMDKRNST